MHAFDRRTDRILIVRPRLHSLQRGKNFAMSIENTVRLKAASDEKSVLAGSEFYTVKILHGKNFRGVLQEFCDM